MRPCALAVDGGAALTEDLQNGLAVVPVRITVGEWEFSDDGDSVAYHDFYLRLREGAPVHTSTPAPGEYLAAFKRLEAEHIVCLTIPSKWSAMFDSATLAAEMFAKEEGRQVTVIDAQAAAAGLALLARTGIELCARGLPADAVVAELRRAAETVRMYGSLATLTYVARSGRVPALVAGISNTLHIRPVFRMHGTDTGRVALARTTSGAIDALERVGAEELVGAPRWLLIFHADAPDDADALARRLSGLPGLASCETVGLSPIAGAYTGPGAFGFAALAPPALIA